MFRVGVGVLLGVIAAALLGWFVTGRSLDGPRVAGWTDLGTWGTGGGHVVKSANSIASAVEKAVTADKPEKTAAAAPVEKSAGKVESELKTAEAGAPKAKDAAPWDLKDTKGVDIDLNVKLPWPKDGDKAAAQPEAKPAPAPATSAPAAPAAVTEKAIDWPIAKESVTWSNVRAQVVAEAPAPAKEVVSVTAKAIDWPIATESVKWSNVRAQVVAEAPAPPKEVVSVTAKAIDWPIAKESVKWTNVRAQAPAEAPAPPKEVVSVTAKAIDWPIAKESVKWTNVRAQAPAEAPAPAKETASVTAKAIDWPIAKESVKWTNVRAQAPAPAATASVTEKAIDWPIAKESVTWTNVRAAAQAPEAEPSPAASVTEKAIDWPIAQESVTWTNVRMAVAEPTPPQPEAERRAQMTEEQIKCEDELRRIYATGTVLFKTNSSVIDKKSTETLDALAQAAKSCAKVRIRVEGHTDSRGTNEFNQSLSERRAQAIAKFLTDAGVAKDAVSAYGYGEERPIAPNDVEANMQKNRRIEFTVY